VAGTRGLNRLVVGVEDLDESIQFYSRLLATEFFRVEPQYTRDYGVRVAVSWAAGIELMALDADGPAATKQALLPFKLGIMGVIFNMDDLDVSLETAKDMGLKVTEVIERDGAILEEQLPGVAQLRHVVPGRSAVFRQYALDSDDHGHLPVTLADIDLRVA
jgi:catechol 2,3-dioxygenase-like lactoylglutathione lyase family enzyme